MLFYFLRLSHSWLKFISLTLLLYSRNAYGEIEMPKISGYKEHPVIKNLFIHPTEDNHVLYVRKKKVSRIKTHVGKRGYVIFTMWLNGKSKGFRFHKLKAETYLKKPSSDHTLVVNHKDHVKINNDLDNLEWGTQKENVDHSINIRQKLFPLYRIMDLTTGRWCTAGSRKGVIEMLACTHRQLSNHIKDPRYPLLFKWEVTRSSTWNLSKEDVGRCNPRELLPYVVEKNGVVFYLATLVEVGELTKITKYTITVGLKNQPVLHAKGFSVRFINSYEEWMKTVIEKSYIDTMLNRSKGNKKQIEVINTLTKEKTTLNGIIELMELTNYSRSTIDRAMKSMREDGWVIFKNLKIRFI